MFLSFLHYCLESDNNNLPDDAKIIDWQGMLIWAERQAIVGVIFNGIRKADKSLRIPKETFF